uniref:Protein-serine/threonine phosphatase n=1 Tax=Caenorhabditis tropicalis TaxID=1561998 RepID=A0A1I7UQL8_9PELO
MSIRHLEDGRFEVLQPFVFRWPAKKVILSILVADAIFSILVIVQSSNIVASFLLCSIVLSAIVAVGYDREIFPIIYIHFVLCLLYIFFFAAIIPMVFYNPQICGGEKCKKMLQWMESVGLPKNWISICCFSVGTLISHILMTPVSLRMMKFTAACKALDEMMADEEFTRRLQRPIYPNISYPIPV